MYRKRQGFTLVELLVVVAIIALLLGILLPAVNRAREIANRTASGASMRGIGQAILVYAAGNSDDFPKYVDDGGTNETEGFSGTTDDTGNYDPFGDDSDDLSDNLTASIWILVRQGDLTPEIFINPSTSDTEFEPEEGISNTFDFALDGTNDGAGADNLSYSFINMFHDDVSRQWSTSASGNYIWAGDDNDNEKDDDVAAADLNENWSNDEKEAWNSTNHQTDGQNFLFADGHVSFEQDPAAGPNDDNAYAADTNDESDAQTIDTSDYLAQQTSTVDMDDPRDVSLVPVEDLE